MFNASSEYLVTDGKDIPEKIIINTMVTATFAGLTHLLTEIVKSDTKNGRMGVLNPISLVSAILAGLCASSGTSKFVTVTSSAIVGVVAAIGY